MNLRNSIVSFIAGFIVYWFSGGLIYGLILKSFFPPMPETPEMMTCIFVGCLIAVALLTFVFNNIGGLTSIQKGFVRGGIICMMVGAAMHAYFYLQMPEWSPIQRLVDLFCNFLMGGLASSSMFFALSKFGAKNS